MPLGDLSLSLQLGRGEIADYSRELSLSDGIAHVAYRVGEVGYTRETFASFPDRVIAIRLASTQPGGVTLKARLMRDSNRYYDAIVQRDASTIVMRGNCGGTGGSDFRAVVRAVATGGSVKLIGEHMLVEQADSVTILVAWRDGAARLCAGGDRTDPDRAMAHRVANPERIENQARRLLLQFSRIPHTS